jgi:signal recognition particle subunit SRP54
MFESLSDRLSGVFDRLRGRGALNEDDVRGAMREVRIALLEADVALPVVRQFVDRATEQAVGQQVLKSITPGQQVVKIVNDALVEMLGADAAELALDVTPPAIIMMVGCRAREKPPSTAKIAKRLSEKERKKVMMASLDVARPAAQEQLAVLGRQANVATLPIVPGQQPVEIARRALQAAKLQGYDVLLLDTAGRLHVDTALMDEMKAVAEVSRPNEILLVVDALTGQDAVNVASSFAGQVDLTGVVLTRLDGDARGGAALSMRAVTGKPIKFAGVGEGIDALEAFHPSPRRRPHPRHGRRRQPRRAGAGDDQGRGGRSARQAHGQGSVRHERPSQPAHADAADGRPRRARRHDAGHEEDRGAAQKAQDDKTLVHLDAIIGSMTPKERLRPELLNAKRKIRVAKGSGTTVQEVNRLLKMHQEMANAMKKIKKMGGLGKLGALFGGGGEWAACSAEWAERAEWAARGRLRRPECRACPGRAEARRSIFRPASTSS